MKPDELLDAKRLQGLQAVYVGGRIWWRHYGEETWIAKTADEAERLARAFAATPNTDRFSTHDHAVAAQLRAAAAERRAADDIEAALAARQLEADPCANLQHLPSAGRGGRPQSPAKTPQSTTASRIKASTPSDAFDTASGPKARSSRPASGGSRARSTPKPANCSPTSAVEPRSTASR